MKKKQRAEIISVVLIVVFAVGILTARAYMSRETAMEDVDTDEEAGFETITYNGEKYRYNTDLKTILFMGVDLSLIHI